MSTVGSVSISDYLNGLTSSTSATSETTEDDGASISKDEFITILMTQMQYQDPLNPMDSEALTSQLTDFSMLEQQIESNSLLEGMSESIGDLTQINMLDYIGKEVTTSSNTLTVDGDDVTKVSFSLDETASVEMVVYDSDGNEINRVDVGETEQGTHSVTWDGTDSSGQAVDDGAYVYNLIATDGSGSSFSVDSSEHGEVTGISYVDGSPYLLVDGKTISFDSIVEITDQSS